MLFVRMYEGPAAALLNGTLSSTSDSDTRLKKILDGLVDVPVIMNSMPAAIKRAVIISR